MATERVNSRVVRFKSRSDLQRTLESRVDGWRKKRSERAGLVAKANRILATLMWGLLMIPWVALVLYVAGARGCH